MNYCLLIATTLDSITAEYFSEYPDLKISRLSDLSYSTLQQQGISGFAVCENVSGIWRTRTFRSANQSVSRLLDRYIKVTLNKF